MGIALRTFYIADWRVEPSLNRLSRNGEIIHLEPKIMQVLVYLAASPAEVITKDRFIREVWGDVFVSEDVLSRSISELRKAFGDRTRSPRFIETIPKMGYRLIAPVHGATDGETGARFRDHSRTLLIGMSFAVLAVLTLSLSLGTRAPTASSSRVPLTSDPGAEELSALSPDGTHVAFVRAEHGGAESALVVKSLDAAGRQSIRWLTSRPGNAPVWSPDGRMIAFARPSGSDTGIYIIPVDGSDENGRRVLAARWNCWNCSRLSWSGDKLAFSEQDAPDQPNHLSIISVDGRSKRGITAPVTNGNAGFGDFWPVFSPDGKFLAFIRSENRLKEDLYLVRASGGAPRLLASGQPRILGLTWTADGKEIVFSANRTGSFHPSLWRISVSGGKPSPVAEGGNNAIDPSISRRGGRLVYTDWHSDVDIWRLPLNRSNGGATSIQLIHSTWYETWPAYSPDGSRIAFVSTRTGPAELWVSNADGSRAVQLTFLKAFTTLSPRWSPDGRLITFVSRHQDHDQIYVVPSAGGQPRRLTQAPANHSAPSWSSDGKWIYFASHPTGEEQIWKTDAAGRDGPIQLTRNGGRQPCESPDGMLLYYTRPREAGIWTVPVSGGRETRIPDFDAIDLSQTWTVKRQGLYFAARDVDRRMRFFLFDLATRRKHPLTEAFSESLYGGIDASPDGRWILAGKSSPPKADIILVENFR